MQFIYKEPQVTPLSEISLRLQAQFAQRFGPDKIVMITDSKDVNPHDLNPELAYMQIIFVEPYFDTPRSSYFEHNHNIREFLYEVPFTSTGRAHGAVQDQWKRKTIVRVEGSSFPYMKKRLVGLRLG